VTALPELTGTETLVTVLLSLLGLGTMRTAEKFGGRARSAWSKFLEGPLPRRVLGRPFQQD
jgi:hypothetical protein